MDTDKLKALALAASKGPWRWEMNENSKSVQLVGGRPTFDKYVMDFARWGMAGAAPRFNDAIASGQYNIMERADKYGAAVPGREHHADWFKDIDHPDAQWIAAANPATVLELIAERDELRAEVERLRAENGGLLSMAKTAETRMDASSEGGHLCAAPAAGTEKDAERYRALRHLMQSAKGSASLEVNQHLAYYEPAEPGQEVKLQWYPDTSIGFYTIEGATLDEVADEAIEFVEAHSKAGSTPCGS